MMYHKTLISLFLAVATLFKPGMTLPHYPLSVQNYALASPSGLGPLIHNISTTPTPTTLLTTQLSKRADGNELFRNSQTDLQCEPAPEGEYRDAHKSKMKEAAEAFCHFVHHSDEPMWTNLPIAQTEQIVTHPKQRYKYGFARDEGFDDAVLWLNQAPVSYDKGGKLPSDVYHMQIERVEGCEEGEDLQKDHKATPYKPLKKLKCEKVMAHAWEKCYGNKGRGGSLQAGCYRYSIRTKF